MFSFPEIITTWVPGQNDGFGRKTWGAPVQYPARISHRQEKFTDINGDTKMSTAVFYTTGLVGIGDMVYLGDSGAVVPPDGANDVRATSQVPSGSGAMKKGWLA